MIKFLSPDGVVDLVPIPSGQLRWAELPMLKPSGRTVPLAELAALETPDERVIRLSESDSPDCCRATTSPLNSSSFKDGGVFVAAAKPGHGCVFAGPVVLPAARTPPDEPQRCKLYSKDPVPNVE